MEQEGKFIVHPTSMVRLYEWSEENHEDCTESRNEKRTNLAADSCLNDHSFTSTKKRGRAPSPIPLEDAKLEDAPQPPEATPSTPSTPKKGKKVLACALSAKIGDDMVKNLQNLPKDRAPPNLNPGC